MSETDFTKTFRAIIQNKIPVLLDGAIGTEIYKKGIFINRCFEEINLSQPSIVKEIHQEYLKAGAMALSTNSWGANRFKLKSFNLEDKLYEINFEASKLAKNIARDKAAVMGCIGPLGIRIEPFGPTSFQEAKDAFKEQAQALLDGGADWISLETFSDLSEIDQAIQGVREVSKTVPLFAHVFMTHSGTLPPGTPILWAMEKLNQWDTDVIGLNCSVGPQPMVSYLEKILPLISKPFCVQPNAGLPKEVEGRKIYMSTPEYLATFAKNFLEMGVQFIGGCCGTTPEHIQVMNATLRLARAQKQKAQHHFKEIEIIDNDQAVFKKDLIKRVPLEEKSKWSKKIAQKQFVTSVELLPPQGQDASSVIEKSKTLKLGGVDAINIPDGPRASARMSAILTSVMIEKEAGIETVLHYTCRDRNLLGMQSDMLGAQAIGLRNMLLITGDPPKLGSYPGATGVFDVDSIGLTNMVHRLNGGMDLGGRSIAKPCELSIGVGVNPVHRDFQYEMDRFAWKVDAGAEWCITQPVFDIRALHRFLNYVEQKNIRIPVIAGVWPLTSYRNALFMQNEVPGVEIPLDVMTRMQNAGSKASEEGILLAKELLSSIMKDVNGVQVCAPFGRIDLALQVLSALTSVGGAQR